MVPNPVPEVLPVDLKKELEGNDPPLLLDIREEDERQICVLPGDIWIPMHEIPTRRDEVDADRHIVVYCHVGVRSRQVVAFLRRYGFNNTRNLATGIDGWAQTVDPSMPRY
jgi:sulfur-carrier protein adenylyltransferase/sulfurtransferase